MAAHARLKNAFTEEEKCHNLMTWLSSSYHYLHYFYRIHHHHHQQPHHHHHNCQCSSRSCGSGNGCTTLKNRLRSPKLNQLFIMSQCYIHANLVEICKPLYEIWVHTSTFWLKFGSLSPAVTLKIRSRSPNPNYLFTMSKLTLHNV